MGRQWYLPLLHDTSDELEHYIDESGRKLRGLGPIACINILVGATNSGKSRFMRGLIKSATDKLLLLDPGVPDPNQALSACWRLARADLHIQVIIDSKCLEHDSSTHWLESPWLAQRLASLESVGPQTYHLTRNDISKVHSWLEADLRSTTTGTVISKQRAQLKEFMEKFRFFLRVLDSGQAARECLALKGNKPSGAVQRDLQLVADFIDCISAATYSTISPDKVYIPVFRTAVPFRGVSTSDTVDALARSISENYGLDAQKAKAEVFTGNLLYWTIQGERSGDPELHRRLKDFERFLGQNFFEGLSVELKPLAEKYDPGRHLALFIDERTQRRFHDLGDGIQAIIILMYRLFTAAQDTWFFIEEPEQGLHPGLQRIFLQTLACHPVLQKKNLTVFMSTHSSHLLGMAMSELQDVSVFGFQRWTDPERFQIRPVHTPEHNLLRALGVVNSSVFLANCGIWVEGITDRKYLRAYLSAYLESGEVEDDFLPQEDVHYAFFEYAGSNLAHYLFETGDDAAEEQATQIHSQFLCNRIFLLADRDEDKEEKHAYFQAMQGDSFQYYVTPGVEIENLISGSELIGVLPKLISAISKKDVAGIEIKEESYRNKRLGAYLKETLPGLCPEALVAASGTLSTHYKNKLADCICSLTTWETMSKDARDLAKALYEFVRRHNQIGPKAA